MSNVSKLVAGQKAAQKRQMLRQKQMMQRRIQDAQSDAEEQKKQMEEEKQRREQEEKKRLEEERLRKQAEQREHEMQVALETERQKTEMLEQEKKNKAKVEGQAKQQLGAPEIPVPGGIVMAAMQQIQDEIAHDEFVAQDQQIAAYDTVPVVNDRTAQADAMLHKMEEKKKMEQQSEQDYIPGMKSRDLLSQ